LSVGFSLNEHGEYKKLPAHPAIELLGCIGLQRFFPQLDAKRQIVRYATWGTPLSPLVARLASIGQLPTVALQRLETRFVYRGSFKGLDTAMAIGGESYD
jgi:CRISPR-associated protein Csb3